MAFRYDKFNARRFLNVTEAYLGHRNLSYIIQYLEYSTYFLERSTYNIDRYTYHLERFLTQTLDLIFSN